MADEAPGLVCRPTVFRDDAFQLEIHNHFPKRRAVIVQVTRIADAPIN